MSKRFRVCFPSTQEPGKMVCQHRKTLRWIIFPMRSAQMQTKVEKQKTPKAIAKGASVS